jgi:hypothetical protein
MLSPLALFLLINVAAARLLAQSGGLAGNRCLLATDGCENAGVPSKVVTNTHKLERNDRKQHHRDELQDQAQKFCPRQPALTGEPIVSHVHLTSLREAWLPQ